MSEPYWVPLGSAPVDYKGDYAAGMAYLPGDVVVYNGVTYLAVNPSTGSTPGAGLGIPGVGYGTSLPASPVDGQEHILVDSMTAPTFQWRFRYNAASTSAYKWEFIGGPDMFAANDPSFTTSSATYVDATDVGPSITLPRDGAYLITVGAILMPTSNALTHGLISYALGAIGAGDSWAAQYAAAANNALGRASCQCTRFHPSVAAGALIRAKYKAGASTIDFTIRTLGVRPVRVS